MSVGKCFGANFARCRKEAGLTQEAVSHMAGVHRTEIGTLERGNRIPRIDTLVKLAATVGVKPEDLLEGIVWEPGKIYSGALSKSRCRVLGRFSGRFRLSARPREEARLARNDGRKEGTQGDHQGRRRARMAGQRN